MAQVNAGDIITIKVENSTISVKIEDASKSDIILAKVKESALSNFKVDQVYEFDRNSIQSE